MLRARGKGCICVWLGDGDGSASALSGRMLGLHPAWEVQANLVAAHAAGGETRPLSSPLHAPRAEPASSRAILWQLAAGWKPVAAMLKACCVWLNHDSALRLPLAT